MPTLAAMAEAVATLLKARGETVAVSESSTGGLISCGPAGGAGRVGVFHRRRRGLHPQGARGAARAAPRGPSGDAREHRGLCVLCASAIRARLGTTWGLGETGATGPSGNRYGDAPGHSCIAVAGPRTRSLTLETGQSDREANMWRFARAALDLLEQVIRSG